MGALWIRYFVLHPCQHLVGSGCWSKVPDEQKEECPVCEVKILGNESVRVHNTVARYDLAKGKKLNERVCSRRNFAVACDLDEVADKHINIEE